MSPLFPPLNTGNISANRQKHDKKSVTLAVPACRLWLSTSSAGIDQGLERSAATYRTPWSPGQKQPTSCPGFPKWRLYLIPKSYEICLNFLNSFSTVHLLPVSRCPWDASQIQKFGLSFFFSPSYLTWSLIPIATWPILTCRRSRILRHWSSRTFSIQTSMPAESEGFKFNSKSGLIRMHWAVKFSCLTFEAVTWRLVGWPVHKRVYVTVAGGENSRAQIIWWTVGLLKRTPKFDLECNISHFCKVQHGIT